MFSSTPTGWDPAVEPPCAAGEAKREYPWTVWGGRTPHPPQVAPGFAAAWRAGILPPPPANEPPTALPGLSASARVWSAVICFFGAIGGCTVVDRSGLPTELFLPLALFGLVSSGWLLSTVHARADAEHRAGYTTLPASGTWRLNSRGAVVAAPDRSLPPPGWYPSPYFPGMLQRWDGPGWAPLPQRWTRRSARYFRAVSPWWVMDDLS